ncbi:MAG TPA: gamma-glutamylcyclotransferase family protein [Alphaproteobacteria bacterium]|nr:gamma-glutamylcyclotransferase family protein [Alphaproteobacteria bacterium]
MDLFFYGTLIDADVRRMVLGKAAEELALVPARLGGYRRMAKRHSTAPNLVARKGVVVDGVLARGISRRELARLCHYEGRNYYLRRCVVRLTDGKTQHALVYLCDGHVSLRRGGWRLDEWQRRHKRAFLRVMSLWMAAFREAGYLARGRTRWVKRWAVRDRYSSHLKEKG